MDNANRTRSWSGGKGPARGRVAICRPDMTRGTRLVGAAPDFITKWFFFVIVGIFIDIMPDF
jgi:hypothetical protein